MVHGEYTRADGPKFNLFANLSQIVGSEMCIRDRAHYLVHLGTRPESAAISPCTFTMDHNAIICFMTDRLKRGPDQDVHVPGVGSQKYPSYNVDVLYL